MALKVILNAEEFEALSEGVKGEYVEAQVNGKPLYVLQLDGVENHPNVATLRTTYNKVNEEKKRLTQELTEAKATLANFPEDFDPDNYERMRQEEEARLNDPEGKDVQKRIDQAVQARLNQAEAKYLREKKQIEAKVTELEKGIKDKDSFIHRLLVRDGLRAAIVGAGVKKGLVDAAIAMHEPNVVVVEESGEYRARMKDEHGGEEVTAFISTWAQSDNAKDFIEPAKSDGEGGSRQRPGFNGHDNPFSKQGWSKTEQGKLLQKDPSRAEAMARQAGFKNLDIAKKAVTPVQ